MAIIRCSNSHYYDNEIFRECPHCAKAAGMQGQKEDSVTVAMAHEAQKVENYAVEYLRKSAPNAHIHVPVEKDSEKTISIYEKKGISKFTAGWLVCVQGEEYGRDFPIYAGFNRIGRSHGNDIVLKDAQISREEHCSIIYEEKKNRFYILPKGGSLVYVEENLLEQAQEIKSGQVITIGETQLEFIAFCTGEKRWANKE